MNKHIVLRNSNDLEFHPIADIFPMLNKKNLDELKKNIELNGLMNPIVMHEGKILDGRNRYLACLEAKKKPDFETYDGSDPLKFVISQNLHRRHLNESQRSIIGAKLADMPEGNPNLNPANLQSCVSVPKMAKMMNVSERSIFSGKSILRDAPEKIAEIERGEKTINEVRKEIRKVQQVKDFETATKKVTQDKKDSLKSVCDIRVCSFDELLKEVKPDVIITDPPYQKEYLHLYEKLAEASKNVPIVAVMCGQTYLNEILAAMSKHLKYRWTMCYRTPGSALKQWDRKIDCNWKPILLFGKCERFIGDVFESASSDKSFHEWGQSESGMSDLVEGLTTPGQLVCDPFLGAGTTAVVSLRLNRRFVGCDIDEKCVKLSIERVEIDNATDIKAEGITKEDYERN